MRGGERSGKWPFYESRHRGERLAGLGVKNHSVSKSQSCDFLQGGLVGRVELGVGFKSGRRDKLEEAVGGGPKGQTVTKRVIAVIVRTFRKEIRIKSP